MLNLVHICFHDSLSHMSSSYSPHVSHPMYSCAHMFLPSYFPHLLVPWVFPHIYKTCKLCMFLQFIHWLQLSCLQLMFNLSITSFISSGLWKLLNSQTSTFRLCVCLETVFHGTFQLYNFLSVHWKHTIPAYIQNTWTATEGWHSTWAEAPVQNLLISRNCETQSTCWVAEAWLVAGNIFSK